MACLDLTLKQYNTMYNFTKGTLIFKAEIWIDQQIFGFMQNKCIYNMLIIFIVGPREGKWEGNLIAVRKNNISFTY